MTGVCHAPRTPHARKQAGEGRLFAHQIVGLDLRHVRLVTLSACESSPIRFDHNDNLVVLSSAFLLAGAA
jgi:CHAT domain-containing protein